MSSRIRLSVLLVIVFVLGMVEIDKGQAAEHAGATCDFHYVGRFKQFRWNSDVLEGLDRITGRWRVVPRLKKEELARHDKTQGLEPVKVYGTLLNTAKGDTLFRESFEVSDCPHCPSEPSFYISGTWNSWDNDYDPLTDNPMSIWGITCDRAHSGQGSAWCTKWEQLCTPEDCEDNTWHCVDTEYGMAARPQVSSILYLNESLSWADNTVTELSFWCWQGFDPDNGDNGCQDIMNIYLVDHDTGDYYAFAELHDRVASWVFHHYELPRGQVDGHRFGVAFEYVYMNYVNWDNTAGAFIDDVAIVSRDVNLTVTYAVTDGAQYDIDDPVHVTVTVANTGADPSPSCRLGYTQNRDLPGPYDENPEYTGVIDVPSVPPFGTASVEFDVYYRDGLNAKRSYQSIAHDLCFRIDPDNVVTETDEYDNDCIDCATATWFVPRPPIILIHGYMGGGLIKNGQWVYGEHDVVTAILHPERLMRDYTTDYEADGALMLVPNAYPPDNGFIRNAAIELSPGDLGLGLESVNVSYQPEGMQGMWDPLIDLLCNQGGYQLGDDLLLFNYDWRKELNPRRQLPDGLLMAVDRLDSLVNDIVNVRQLPGAERLTIVSHSMGGLVAQAYLRANPDDNYVFRWITLGTPFQGTLDSFAALFNANAGPLTRYGLGNTIIGTMAARKTGDLVQEFVSTWEMLPTSFFDMTVPTVPGKWEGHGIYADLGFQPWGLRRIPLPILASSQYTCTQVKNNDCGDCWNGMWRHNPYSRDHSATFQGTFMDMSPQHKIDNVDTWLIACPNRHTLRGVVHYEKWPTTWLYSFPITFYKSHKYHVMFGDGDGVVPAWSATTANIDSTHLHVRYCDNIGHRALVQDQGLAHFVYDIIMDSSLEWYDNQYPEDPEQIFDMEHDNERPWSIEWRTDTAVWNPAGKDSYEELPVYPVSLELVDRVSQEPLVWIMEISDPVTGESVLEPMILDDRFIGYTFGDQITLSSNYQGPMSLRLIVRPSPQLFPPAGMPAVKEGTIPNDAFFTVLGQLSIYTNVFDWRFPDPDIGLEDFIEFQRLGVGDVHYGFQAFVDFDVNGGIVQQTELDLHVDADGDGWEDYTVTPVPPAEEIAVASLEAFPNPFNPVTSLRWELPKEQSAAELIICDVSGRLLKKYPLRGGGRGNVRWGGCDMSGKRMPAGVYFAVLTASTGEVLTRCKLMMVK